MKKGLLFGMSMFLFHLVSWGIGVTFQVDMSNEAVSPLGVHLAGSFADGNGDGVVDNNLPNWNPGGIALNDNGNGIWSVTIDLVAGLYEYKFVNGNDWSNPEFFDSNDNCPQWLNGNRYILFDESITTLMVPMVCWNGCVACGQGCMDPSACNYEMLATVEGPCTYPDSVPEIIIEQPTLGCFNDGVVLYPNGGNFAQIGWGTSFGAITSVSDTLVINGSVMDDFYFIGTQADGCVVNLGPFNIEVNEPEPISICLVTVDETTNKNHIIWESIANTNVDKIVVYKETGVQDEFVEIGQVDYTATGMFEDMDSNPQEQSNRYKIGMKDVCGFIYSSSNSVHKTIHLMSDWGLNGEVNLTWSAYEGIAFSSYNIYRGSGMGAMTLLATVPSNTLSYSDLNPMVDQSQYMIEVAGIGCDPSRSAIFSRSNVMNTEGMSIQEFTQELYVKMNVNEDVLNIQSKSFKSGELIRIFNDQGQLIHEHVVTGENEIIPIKHLSQGLYIVSYRDLAWRFIFN